MADPNWSSQYNFGQMPEQQGFTRILYGSPVVNTVTTGAAANRRVDITTDAGDCVFVTSNVPALNEAVGITAEASVVVSGSGNAGFQAVFLQFAVELDVKSNLMRIIMPGISNTTVDQEFTGQNNTSPVLIRLTVNPAGVVRIYRNAIQLGNGFQRPSQPQVQQSFQWWGEGGGLQSFRALKTYWGGEVAP